jgi:hypothetical protein
MLYETVYGIATKLALVGWPLLIVALFVPAIRRFVFPLAQFVLPAVYGLLYLMMVWEGRGALHLPASFTTLPGIAALFADHSALTAGWIHIIAMDMFAGAWIAQDGLALRVPKLLIALILVLTFTFGPSGLLVYILLRFFWARRAPGRASAA